ncbi:hypothetical protein P8452_08313 [Trifolium repens]|nr:hypothetical protein P8452_08313 [Trifolium repens]
MDVVGISSEEKEAIFRVVAAILHLGNIEFSKGKEMDSSMPKDEKSQFHLQTAAELFMCDAKALEDSLRKRVVVTRDETIIVYSRLFHWLVDKINNSIGQDPDSKFLIGVLDIYGFESFKTNSFEQFCINLTNEKLQQHFNQHVFKMEQEEYKKEEIDWSYIEFVDNQDILDLIEKIGKTKVFLRAGQMEELDTYRSEILGKSASIIQRKVRSYLARRSFVSIRLSAIQIHFKSHCRKYLVQHHFKNLKKAAIAT